MSLFDSGIRPAIDQWLLDKSKEERDYGDYWSASSAGYCMRRVMFQRLKVPPVEREDAARKQRVFTAGHLFHDWIQGLTKEAGLSIAQELELQDEELMIRGHIDDLILIQGETMTGHGDNMDVYKEDDRLILYDYKTSNSRAFDYKKEQMSHYHKMQLGTYMYMLRSKTFKWTGRTNYTLEPNTLSEARILIIEKDTLRQKEQQLLWSPELEAEVLGYWRILNDYWKQKKFPPCQCHKYEVNSRTGKGFMADKRYNDYFYEDEPCSIRWYERCKKEGLI